MHSCNIGMKINGMKVYVRTRPCQMRVRRIINFSLIKLHLILLSNSIFNFSLCKVVGHMYEVLKKDESELFNFHSIPFLFILDAKSLIYESFSYKIMK